MTEETPLDTALTELGRTDPTFNEEVRRRLGPVQGRFFDASPSQAADSRRDGLRTAPPYLSDPKLKSVAIELAALALERGIDVNLACDSHGSTFLHECVSLRDLSIAAECVAWLLAHGADPNRQRDDGHTALSLALSLGRTELAKLIQDQQHS